MNHFNIEDETLHELVGVFSQFIAEKGLNNHLAIEQVTFRNPLSDNCRQVPVCSQVTDPTTHQTHTVCHLETVCD